MPRWRQLADKWEEVGADIAVILGNDQDEVYETEQLNPAFMVFFGDKIPNYPQTEEQRNKLPPGIAEAEHGHATETYTEYPGVPDLGAHIIKTLCDREFDVAASKVWPKHARNGASHAFGHIYRQVMRDNVVPNVPIYQNTFFPPNQPKASRSYRFGQIVKEAIELVAVGQEGRRVCVRRNEPLCHRRSVRPQIRRRSWPQGQELSDVDSAQGIAIRHLGTEVVDFARGV